MKHVRKDETGNKYGRLKVINFNGINKSNNALWNCVCDCGKAVVVIGNCLRSGNTKSCGCINREGNPTHGLFYHPIYKSYQAAKSRCTYSSQPHWHDYGGRGIEFRLGSFEEFNAAMKDSWFDGATIGRKDVDGHYEYGNIRWETNAQQARNKRANVKYTHNGETLIQSDWARKIGITEVSLAERIKNWGLERALTTPRMNKGKPNTRLPLSEGGN